MLRAALPAGALAFALVTTLAAAPPVPVPPPQFADQQSPVKPAPFDVKYVDQGTFDPKLAGISAPEGFRLELVAEAPDIVNPVAMTFAPDGTLFVAEWAPDPGREWFELKETFHYRDGSTKSIATMKKYVMDPIKVLKRDPKTGKYDRPETIFTDELPSTLLYHEGWLYTASRGSVRRYRQGVPGGKWDVRETIAQGFCGFHHHQVSGLTMGPDGWLYITSGDDDNFAEGSDGSRATALRTGAIFRCLPDGSKLELFSLGYRNPYRDLALDEKGNWFHADNDNEDGSRFTGCRLVHVAEDVDYGWRLLEGARCCKPDHGRGAVAGERPGKLPPMLKTGRGSPAGVLLYNDTQLPEQYRGLMYYPDVFRKLVRAYKLAPLGSSFQITHEFEFLKTTDPLFRPCQMIAGPDGAIYICDWRTDSGGAGKLWGDGKHGRLYRLTWTGTKAIPAIALRPYETWKNHATPAVTLEAVIEGLRSPDDSTRRLAQKEFIRRSRTTADEIRKVAITLTDSKEPVPTRLLAYGTLAQLWNAEAEASVLNGLDDKDGDVRRTSAELLGRFAKPGTFAVQEPLIRRLRDEAPMVRRAAALALGRLGGEGAAAALAAAWQADKKDDPFLTDAYLRGLERTGAWGLQELLGLAASGDDIQLKKVVDAFIAFRSPVAAKSLPQLLANVHLAAKQKSALIESYLYYQFDPPLSLDPLVAWLAKRPDEPAEVKLAALDTLTAMGGLNSPARLAFTADLLKSKEDDSRLAALAAIEKARLQSPAIASTVAAMLADAKRSDAERSAAAKAARVVGGPEAPAALKDILSSKSAATALKVEALRSLGQIEPNAARTFATAFLDQPEPALIAEAVAVLGTTKDGALLVGERYAAKKLPRDLFPQVSAVLRGYTADEKIAKLNAEVLRGGLLLSLAPDQVEKIRREVQTKGDPKRGRVLYLNASLVACASCHKLEGIGGQVGPDLTRIWDTTTTEKLLESMIAPSKEIKEGYQTFTALSADGQSYSGLKVIDSPAEVVLREATGRDIRLARKDLDKLTASNQSLMPDNVVSQLSYEQFLDLLAFLKSKTEQENLRGQMLEASLTVATAGEAKVDPATKPTAVAADAGGLLVLKPLLPTTPTGFELKASVYSATKQKVTATLLADDALRIAIGSGAKPAFDRDVPKLGKFEDVETFTVELEAGWNAIAVRGFSNGPSHRFGLRFGGDGVRMAAEGK